MKTVEYANWMLLSEVTGKRRASRWKMTREDALARDTGATPCPGTLELRQIPETEAEHAQSLYRMFRPAP